ncbi:MAG TPA: hypothetical protein VFI37_03710 [Gaiellaceae bacterium]|jgi:hypothetical protein|nr:hypothetical protein [Gaiellaceae bacterium]
MPTRKQRRRREKSFRHEYELVEIDPETGEEHPVDATALKAEKPKHDRPAAAAAKKQPAARRGGRAGREPQPPSWQRVLKRTALFAPLMALFIYWTQSSSKNGVSVTQVVVNTAILIAFFAPFSYLVDSMSYRFYAKRTGKLPAKDAPSKR